MSAAYAFGRPLPLGEAPPVPFRDGEEFLAATLGVVAACLCAALKERQEPPSADAATLRAEAKRRRELWQARMPQGPSAIPLCQAAWALPLGPDDLLLLGMLLAVELSPLLAPKLCSLAGVEGRPTVAVLGALLQPGEEGARRAAARLLPAAPLLRFALVTLGEDGAIPLYGRTLRADPRVVSMALHPLAAHGELGVFLHRARSGHPALLTLPEDLLLPLQKLCLRAGPPAPLGLILAPLGSDLANLLVDVALAEGRPALVAMASRLRSRRAVAALCREALLAGAVVLVSVTERLPRPALERLVARLFTYPVPVLLAVEGQGPSPMGAMISLVTLRLPLATR